VKRVGFGWSALVEWGLIYRQARSRVCLNTGRQTGLHADVMGLMGRVVSGCAPSCQSSWPPGLDWPDKSSHAWPSGLEAKPKHGPKGASCWHDPLTIVPGHAKLIVLQAGSFIPTQMTRFGFIP
jgi:hypothetical protein